MSHFHVWCGKLHTNDKKEANVEGIRALCDENERTDNA